MGRVRSLDGRSTQRATRRRLDAISPAGSAVLRRFIRSVWLLGLRAVLRLRLVSESHQRHLAAVLRRTLDVRERVRLDMGWSRTMVVADTSLRTLGTVSESMVLGSRSSMGTRVGVVGLLADVRELVSAWI